MLEIVRRVLEEVKDISYEEYLSDSRLWRAIHYDLTVLGEASGQVSDRFKEGHDQIPWRDMKELRNRVIHGYFSVRHEVVWRVLTVEFPALLP